MFENYVARVNYSIWTTDTSTKATSLQIRFKAWLPLRKYVTTTTLMSAYRSTPYVFAPYYHYVQALDVPYLRTY